MITEIDGKQFQGEVLGSAVPVLVEFFTPHCSPCWQMLPILDEIAGERVAALKVFKFDAGENPQFASQFGIRSVPNFLIFKGGNPVGQRSGFVPKRELLAWIDSAVA